MRRFAAIYLWLVVAFFMVINHVAAQTVAPQAVSATPAPSATPLPSLTPTPNPIDACFEKGPIACLPGVARELGTWGVVILLGIFLLIFFVFNPLGKIIQDGIQEWFKSHIFRSAPLSSTQIERREAEYIQALSQSELLKSPDQMMVHLDAYLAGLRDHENPLKPSEEKVYVPLEGGLDISPRIGLYRGGQPDERFSLLRWVKDHLFRQYQSVEASKIFTEQKVFANIEDAVNAVDETTQAPYPVLALLGEPGAGKSTLLRKFMRDRVKKRLEDPSEPLPFSVSLSTHKSGSPLTFLRKEWKRTLGFNGLDEALAEGRIWLFADGLNEMPRSGFDTRLAQWRAFLREHFTPHGNRALITCRVADYGEGISAPRLIIHRMDDSHIFDFLQKRIPGHAAVLWQELKRDHVERSGSIYELSKTPFWLVMLTRLSSSAGLPGNRANLLDEFIKTWLDYENSRPSGRVLDNEQRQAFMNSLTDLAWEGLKHSQNYTFQRKEACKVLCAKQKLVSIEELLGLGQDCSLLTIEDQSLRFQHQLLQEFFAARELARQFVAGINLRSKWRTPWRRWKLVRSRWDPLPDPPRTGWEEAVILAAGMLDDIQADRLTQAVLKDNPPLAARCVMESGASISPETQRKTKERLQQDLESPRVRLPARLFAGRTLAKMGDPRLLNRQHECEYADGKVFHFIEPEWIDIPEGVFTMGSTPQEIQRLRIFYRLQPSSDELPAHKVFTSAFQMARYPVTVAEYRSFMDAGGYENDTYWQEANALRWRNAPLPFEESYAAYRIQLLRENEKAILEDLDRWVKQGSYSPAEANAIRQQIKMQDDAIKNQWDGYEAQKRNAQGRVTRPWGWENSDLAVDNQPVVGVTWYEACAYAAWLTDRLHQQNLLEKLMRLRLPTETEWEKAARSKPAAGESQQGLWAWGNRWSTNHANTLEGRVMKPTPVGAYPQGASRCGIQDLHGNVWEWCSDWYAGDSYNNRANQVIKDPQGPEQGTARVMRGGSWDVNRHGARCADRLRGEPGNFGYYVGFRLVRSPSTSAL